MPEILAATRVGGYDMNGVARRIAHGCKTCTDTGNANCDILMVGVGAGGIAVAASLRSRTSGQSDAVIDPADLHYCQPGWTMDGGGILQAQRTARTMGRPIPRDVTRIKAVVAAFEPQNNAVMAECSSPRSRPGRWAGRSRPGRPGF